MRLFEGGGIVPTFQYTFKVTYTRIADELEPNDTSDMPAARARHADDGVLLRRLRLGESTHS